MSFPLISEKGKGVFEQQADANLTQASAVSGTIYAVLATTKNIRIISIASLDDWSVDTTTLEIHVIIDGLTYIFTIDPDDNVWYIAKELLSDEVPANQVLGLVEETIMPYFLEGKSVAISVESTGGTSDSLKCKVRHAKIP